MSLDVNQNFGKGWETVGRSGKVSYYFSTLDIGLDGTKLELILFYPLQMDGKLLHLMGLSWSFSVQPGVVNNRVKDLFPSYGRVWGKVER